MTRTRPLNDTTKTVLNGAFNKLLLGKTTDPFAVINKVFDYRQNWLANEKPSLKLAFVIINYIYFTRNYRKFHIDEGVF